MNRISSPRAFSLWVGLVLTMITLCLVLPVLHIQLSHSADWPRLVGDRTEAVFDLWSFQHLCSGILIGSFLVYGRFLHQCKWRRFALVMLLCSLLWEAAELSMEAGAFGEAVMLWKRGFEHWGNRFVGDPLMVVSGGLAARHYASAWKFVLLPAGLWFAINVACPSSMSVQEIFFGP